MQEHTYECEGEFQCIYFMYLDCFLFKEMTIDFCELLQMKRMRGVLLSGGGNMEDITAHIRLLIPSFQLSVKDLRSQVVREACITIAFLAQQLGSPRLDQFAEALLPHLINLIPNSAKVGQGYRSLFT